MDSRVTDFYISEVPYGGVALFHVSILLSSIPSKANTAAGVFGEILNAAAYAFAPAILVTPLGALSVLIG
jgi:hypothetical protein